MIDLRRYDLLFGSDPGPPNYATVRRIITCPHCHARGSVKGPRGESIWRRDHQCPTNQEGNP